MTVYKLKDMLEPEVFLESLFSISEVNIIITVDFGALKLLPLALLLSLLYQRFRCISLSPSAGTHDSTVDVRQSKE